MARVYNFSAGPSQLPEEVLARASKELVEYGSSGQSVMEMSHRSPEYQAIIDKCEADLRDLMAIPDNYKVLFLQGGASMQFAMVPLNIMNGSGQADYVQTGLWSKKAAKEAARFGKVNIVASSEDSTFNYIPDIPADKLNPNADYFYVCYNNTIYGTVFSSLPDTGKVPVVADMSSCFLSAPVDVSKFGIIFAGAQKNFGPAGVTVVIIREDLIGNARESTPIMLNYKTHADEGSMFNTPPTYTIYMCGLVLDWLREQGGISAMEKRNKAKAKLLYDYLDSSKMFHATVRPDSRSLMNVPFVTGNEELDKKFVKEAAAAGFINLKGHRSVGGMRASIYNAMPVAGIEKLVALMAAFEAKNS
ncbi:MAG: 3-phosphoserine/phosphohydroxythreonine transaminase [Angelakisella sp.]